MIKTYESGDSALPGVGIASSFRMRGPSQMGVVVNGVRPHFVGDDHRLERIRLQIKKKTKKKSSKLM